MKTNKLLRYVGSKDRFLPIIKSKFNPSTKILIEPFCGSTVISLNSNEFDKIIINDKSKELIRVLRAVKEFTYSDLIEIHNYSLSEFGCIKTDKEAYYNFRNWVNEKYFNNSETIGGLYYYFLYNSCINSMARYGPNGFNQSFGRRLYITPEDQFINIKEILNKTLILNEDAYTIIDEYKDNKEVQFFIDPPYFSRPIEYNNEIINEDLYLNHLEVMKTINTAVCYTDSFDKKQLELSDYNSVELRRMNSIAPNSNKSSTKIEMLYFKLN